MNTQTTVYFNSIIIWEYHLGCIWGLLSVSVMNPIYVLTCLGVFWSFSSTEAWQFCLYACYMNMYMWGDCVDWSEENLGIHLYININLMVAGLHQETHWISLPRTRIWGHHVHRLNANRMNTIKKQLKIRKKKKKFHQLAIFSGTLIEDCDLQVHKTLVNVAAKLFLGSFSAYRLKPVHFLNPSYINSPGTAKL